MAKKKTTKETKSGRLVVFKRGDATFVPAVTSSALHDVVIELKRGTPKSEQQAVHQVKWTVRQIKASRVRTERASKRIERLSRETDAVLARLKAAS